MIPWNSTMRMSQQTPPLVKQQSLSHDERLTGFYKILTNGSRWGTMLFTDRGDYLSFQTLHFQIREQKKTLWNLDGVVLTPHSMVPKELLTHPPLLIEYYFNRRVPTQCQGFRVMLRGEQLMEIHDMDFQADPNDVQCQVKRITAYKFDDKKGRDVPSDFVSEHLVGGDEIVSRS